MAIARACGTSRHSHIARAARDIRRAVGGVHAWAVLFAVSLSFNIYLIIFHIGLESDLDSGAGNCRQEIYSALSSFVGAEGARDGIPSFSRHLSDAHGSSDSSDSMDSSSSSSLQASGVSSGTSSASGCGSGSGVSGEHAHQYDALLYLFNAFVVGCAVLHLLTLLPKLQETVVLFVLGMLYSFAMEGLNMKAVSSNLGHSYEMWMDIDPHTLLFTLLPALLAGDAMTIDTSVAKRVAKQCIFLAGPGVLTYAFMVAGTLYAMYPLLEWPFLLCLCTGSILCATDPVAVVALLKELGASPILTVQIQGESLLNDGSAIVLFLITYNMLSGKEYDFIDIMMFLVRSAFLAWGLGMFCGYFFFSWFRLAANKLEHHSGMIQIILTICNAYVSFIWAEGVFGMSGVLSTVASSLVLAHHMWPHAVSPSSLHQVWHTLEALGNMLIFFLAGSLTGRVMIHIEAINYAYLIIIYIMLVVYRGILIFGCRPLLKILSAERQPVTVADAAVMTWGGLRGAVGLALAIQVYKHRAENLQGEYTISEKHGEQVLFFVAGVAFLTTIINAPTAPMLVNYLGITALPKAQLRLLRMLYKRLLDVADDKSFPRHVVDSLKHMCAQIDHGMSHYQVQDDESKAKHSSESSDVSVAGASAPTEVFENHATVIKNYELVLDTWNDLGPSSLDFLSELPQPNYMGDVDHLMDLIRPLETVDVPMARAINKSFLGLVSQNYWNEINLGNLRAGSTETDILLTSIRMAMSPLRGDLVDWVFVRQQVLALGKDEKWWKVAPEECLSRKDLAPGDPSIHTLADDDAGEARTGIHALVKSKGFNLFIGIMISLNGIYVGVDELARKPSNEFSIWWVVFEAVFTVTFLVEFVVKCIAVRCEYFKDNWNRFDFALVVLGVLGLALSCQTAAMRNDSADSARLVRLSRVFRVLRFLRVIRLFHDKMGADIMPQQVATHMQRIVTLTHFAHAHLNAEQQLTKYYGGNNCIDEADEAELARCVLQSQVLVYRALTMAIQEEEKMDKELILEFKWVRQCKKIVESLEHFVTSAFDDGAISAREAEAIIHPMHHTLATCLRHMSNTTSARALVPPSLKTMIVPASLPPDAEPGDTVPEEVLLE